MSFTIYDKTKSSKKEKLLWFAQQDSKKWKNIDKKRNEIQENFKVNRKVENKVNKINRDKIDFNKIEMNKIEMNKIEMNKIEMNKIEMNKIEMNKIEINLPNPEPDNSGW
jgi:hypothetical protein